jgi:hypothetical protein
MEKDYKSDEAPKLLPPLLEFQRKARKKELLLKQVSARCLSENLSTADQLYWKYILKRKKQKKSRAAQR